jgi:signal transduction histidine kinase
VVNDELELLYSSPGARQQLRLPKIGEKISSKDIVHHSNERLVYDGVRMALKDQQVQCYHDLRMAAQPEPIAAELKIEVYPSAGNNTSRVLMEWFPVDGKGTQKPKPIKVLESSEAQMSRALANMENAMLRMKQEIMALSRENAKLRVFAMSASHDLRSPLMCWRYSLELITQYNTEEKKLEACRDGRRAAQRFETLLNLLDELVYDEKARGGRARIVSLEEVMKTVLFLLELDINHTRASITYDFSLLAKVRYPKAFLAIILLNLLSNACKYRDSKRPLAVHVSTEPLDDHFILKNQR